MLHMGRTLVESNFSDVDVRIKPCIVDFLRTKMKKYAAATRAHNYNAWRFDEGDFLFTAKDPEMVALYRAACANPEAPGASTLSPQDVANLRMSLVQGEEDIDGFTVKELKQFLSRKGVSQSKIARCVEKEEMVALAKKIWAAKNEGAGGGKASRQ